MEDDVEDVKGEDEDASDERALSIPVSSPSSQARDGRN